MRLVLAILLALIAAPSWALDITSPGVHRLSGNVSAANYPIRILANGVLLDLNGFTVSCTPSSPATAQTFGIDANGRSGVHVYNGRVTGCMFGIQMGSASNVSVVGVDLTGNTYVGVNIGYATNARVRGCTFAAITGYTAEAYSVGVNGVGSGALIEGNTFRDFDRQPGAAGVGEGVAVLVTAGAQGVTIRGNWFENSDPEMDTIGLWVAQDTGNITIAENSFTNIRDAIGGFVGVANDNRFLMRAPVADSVAISFNNGTATDNVIVGYETALWPGDATYQGVTDGGGNIIVDGPEVPPPPEPQDPETVFDVALSGSFGNIETKTIKVAIHPAPPSGPVQFVRLTLQGHADEPLVLSKLFLGSVSLGAVTVPQGGIYVTPWIAYAWDGTSPLVVSAYSPGPAISDRLAAVTGQGGVTWLRIGDHAAQSGTAGFTAYSGYSSLVSKIEVAG